MSKSASLKKLMIKYNPIREHKIILKGQKYIIYWTPHAAHRAEYRGCSVEMLGVFLADALKDIVRHNNKLIHEGYICIRDFKNSLFAVINISGQKIRVITCGDVRELYPRKAEYVINRHKNDEIQQLYWVEK